MTPEQLQALKNFYIGQEAHIVPIKFADGDDGYVRYFTTEKKEVNQAEGSIVHLISTPRIDYVKDIMNPFGVDDGALKKNKAVFYNHSWSGSKDLPIGKNLWIKSQRTGVLAKTQYAINENAFAGDVFRLVVNDFLNSYSIGWNMKDWEIVLVSDLPKIIDGQYDVVNINDFKPEDKVMVHKTWGMHEYSQVGIPMNQDAVKHLQEAMAKGFIQTDFGKDVFGAITGREKLNVELEDKGAIGYQDYGNAPEGTAWNGSREVRTASTEDLRKMCAWYDAANPDVKGSYKLPHHRQNDTKAVWRGVAAAMGALLGAMGGVNIPKGDRKGVYNHLARHYEDFNKTAPEFKEYSPEELKEMFPAEELTELIVDLQMELASLRSEVSVINSTVKEVKEWIDAPIEFHELKTSPETPETPTPAEMSRNESKTVEFNLDVEGAVARGISRAMGRVS